MTFAPDTTAVALNSLRDSITAALHGIQASLPVQAQQPPSWVTVAPLAIGFLALIVGVVGPFVQWKIAAKHIRAQTITVSRKEWLATVRLTLSEFLARAAALKWRPEDLSTTAATYADDFRDLDVVYYRLRLLLNPAEASHVSLWNQLEQLNTFVRAVRSIESPDQFHSRLTSLVEDGQAMLKAEWVRIKDEAGGT